MTRQKCRYLCDLFPKKVFIIQTAGFYVNGGKLNDDRLVPENFVYLAGVSILTGIIITKHDYI